MTAPADALPAPGGRKGAVRDVIVVGASAGGVEALVRFVQGLPAGLPATVLVVLHMPARAPSALAAILARRSRLPVRAAGERESLETGTVLVAPPDHHLAVSADGVITTRGPRENGHRPSVDVLFRTAAWHLGARVVAVVLSGSDDDGTVGALEVRRRGGLVFVQSSEDALYPIMPASVARQVGVDASAAAGDLAEAVARALEAGYPDAVPAGPADRALAAEEVAVDENRPEGVLGAPVGEPSGYVCPDCSGALFVVGDGPVLRFRCRIGHAWTGDGLVGQQAQTVETALWTAVRTLQERADLSERLAQRARGDGRLVSARQFHGAALDAREAAAVLQRLLASALPDAGAAGSGAEGSEQEPERRVER